MTQYPAIWECDSLSEMYFASFPIITPSSTSQSDFTDFLGILLLIPPLRVILIRIALKNAIINFQNRRKSKKENNDYIDIDPDN